MAGAIGRVDLAGSLEKGAEALYVPMIDARRMEVYAAVYDQELNEVQAPQAMIIDELAFSAYLERGTHLVLGGNGAPKCQAILQHPQIHYVSVLAAASNSVPLAYLSYQQKDFVDVAYVEPFYLKPPNITVSKKKLP